MARVNPDGTPDITFDPGRGAEGGAVDALLVQDDGGVLLGGDFQSVDGRTVGSLARVQRNGRPDPAFNAGGGANARAG